MMLEPGLKPMVSPAYARPATAPEPEPKPLPRPASTCATCGDRVPQGKGVAQEWDGRTGLSVHGWSRRCERCSTMTDGELIEELTGWPNVTAAEVARLRHPVAAARMFPDWAAAYVIHTEPPAATGARWKHLSDEDRAAIAEEIRRMRLVGTMHANPDGRGACALCGAQRAEKWVEAPSAIRWKNGGPAAICGACAVVWNRRGRPTDRDRLRAVGYELATGVSGLGLHDHDEVRQFRLFFELAPETTGYPTGWAYSPAVTDLQDRLWTANPALAPEDVREHYAELHAAKEAARRAIAEPDPWVLA